MLKYPFAISLEWNLTCLEVISKTLISFTGLYILCGCLWVSCYTSTTEWLWLTPWCINTVDTPRPEAALIETPNFVKLFVTAEKKSCSHSAAFLITCKISAYLHTESRVTGHAAILGDSNVLHAHNMDRLGSRLTGFAQHSYNVIWNWENLILMQSSEVS